MTKKILLSSLLAGALLLNGYAFCENRPAELKIQAFREDGTPIAGKSFRISTVDYMSLMKERFNYTKLISWTEREGETVCLKSSYDRGLFFDTLKGLEIQEMEAEVSALKEILNHSLRGCETDITGTCTLTDLAPGEYFISNASIVDLNGMSWSWSVPVSVKPGEQKKINITKDKGRPSRASEAYIRYYKALCP